MYGKVETLQSSYISSLDIKNQMYSIQYILYKNNNGICKVKVYFTKKISENNHFIGLNLALVLDEEEEAYIIILYLYKSNTQIW